MIELWFLEVLLVYAASVLIEIVGGLHTAGNWTVLVDLSLHLVFAVEGIVVGGVVLLVLDGPALVLARLADWAWWPGAVFALRNGAAGELGWVFGNVLLA